MAINPLNSSHRQRLVRAMDHAHSELCRFNRMRSNTIKAYLGVSPYTDNWDWYSGMTGKGRYERTLPKGNLLQLAGLSQQIALAYGEAQALHTARSPKDAGMADRLNSGVNRMAALLDLGETARAIAADSFFGYGIYKVGIGRLPRSAQVATGLEIGPCVWRVSQNNFIYDIMSPRWNDVAYAGDWYRMPVNEAIELYPDHADRLAAMTDVDRLDSKHVLPKPSQFHSAEEELWIVDIYFPDTGVVGQWPLRGQSFGEVAGPPLQVREFDGHWSGIYEVLNHLYSPDELVPVAQAESVKAIHFLFQDIFDLTSEQARNAKVNPVYQQGSDKDMARLWQAKDRHPVGVADPTKFSSFEIPGPSQSQTSYMAATLNLFKQFVPMVDEPQRAPTATQGQLERQTTNAIVAEARRKFNRSLQLVFYKLGHLLLNDNEIVLPAFKRLRPGSNVQVDVSFRPGPRNTRIDDYDITIDPFSNRFKTPEERLNQLMTINAQLVQFVQLRASGAPVNLENVFETFANYSGLPEIMSWYEEIDPLFAARRSQSRSNPPRIGVGQYTRHNVSERTTAGALEANLQNAGSDNGEQPRFE